MPSIIYAKIGVNKGKPRIWLEGQYLSKNGITQGAFFNVDCDRRNAKITLKF